MDRSKLYSYSDGSRFNGMSVEQVFTAISKNYIWSKKESVSGYGSALEQTSHLIQELPNIFEKLKVRKILDLPCGDFNWMKSVNLTGIKYTGGDIVRGIIERNTWYYQRQYVSFNHINLLQDDLGEHDLLFCRDCMVHFSLNDIYRSLENIKNSRITYLMATTFPEESENKDIVTGGWRPLNLERQPFNFTPPIILLNENCTEGNGVFRDKSLGVWEIADLKI